MNSQVSKKTRRSEEEVLNKLAELLADDFLAKKAAGTLPKPVERGKQSVRK